MDLFGADRKTSMSSRQREVLKVLQENTGAYAHPYKQKNPKAARRYAIQSQDGTILIPSLRRSVIDNLYKRGKLIREEYPEIRYYHPDYAGSVLFEHGQVDVGGTASMYMSMMIDPKKYSQSESNLQINLEKARQHLNG